MVTPVSPNQVSPVNYPHKSRLGFIFLLLIIAGVIVLAYSLVVRKKGGISVTPDFSEKEKQALVDSFKASTPEPLTVKEKQTIISDAKQNSSKNEMSAADKQAFLKSLGQ